MANAMTMPNLAGKASIGLALGALLAFAAISSDSNAAQALRIVFPAFALKRNAEFIEKLTVHVHCGHIDAVNAIPVGWEVNIVRLSAGEERLVAEADHGATRLPSLGRFNGGIRVMPQETGCFRIRASVGVSGEADRKIQVLQQQMQLVP